MHKYMHRHNHAMHRYIMHTYLHAYRIHVYSGRLGLQATGLLRDNNSFDNFQL